MVKSTAEWVRAGILILIMSHAVEAASMFTGQATTTLTLVGFRDGAGADIAKPNDVFVAAFPVVDTDTSSASGGATASTTQSSTVNAQLQPENLIVGDSVVLTATISGASGDTPPTVFDATVVLLGLIDVDNFSGTDTVEVLFEITTEYAINSSADDPILEFAESFVGALAVAGPLATETVEHDVLDITDTDFADGLLEDSITDTFSVIVGPDELFPIDVELFLEGFGFTDVPEPTAGFLFASPLIAAWSLSRRRRPAAAE